MVAAAAVVAAVAAVVVVAVCWRWWQRWRQWWWWWYGGGGGGNGDNGGGGGGGGRCRPPLYLTLSGLAVSMSQSSLAVSSSFLSPPPSLCLSPSLSPYPSWSQLQSLPPSFSVSLSHSVCLSVYLSHLDHRLADLHVSDQPRQRRRLCVDPQPPDAPPLDLALHCPCLLALKTQVWVWG